MQIFSHVRMLLARRPWIYWTSVGAVALALALVMHSWVSDLRHQRNSWGTTTSVLVASSEIPPGAALDAVVTSRRIPQANSVVAWAYRHWSRLGHSSLPTAGSL